MTFTPDCLRDVMLYLSNECPNHKRKDLRLRDVMSEAPFSLYNTQDVLSAVIYAAQKNMLIIPIKDKSLYPRMKIKDVRIIGLGAPGTEFVSSVQEETSWGKIKAMLSDHGGDILSAAVGVAATLLSGS